MIERRRPLLETGLVARVGLAWLLIALLLLAASATAIWQRRFPDGDDIMRLVQLRDWLGGQGWFDLVQYRVGPPEGTAMHWSRLVDLPLAAIVLLFTPLLGPSGAEGAALIIVPLVTLFCALLLLGRIAWRLFDEEATGLACLVAATAVPLIQQMRPMRIDHHGWQVVCALLAVNALMARDARRGGWLAGAAMALWLTISLEALPMVAAILAIGALRWLRCADGRQWLVAMLQALAGAAIGLYFLTRGLPLGPSFCDALSPAHLAALAIAAVGVSTIGALPPRPVPFTLLALGTIALVAITAALQLAPHCSAGSFAAIDPLAREFWLNNVAEGRPIWEQRLATICQIVLPPLIALAVSLRLAARSGGWLRRWWIEYAVLLVAALAVAIFVARAGAIACALAAVPLGWQLKQWLRNIRNLRRPGRQAAALACIVAALLPALPLTLLAKATPGNAARPQEGQMAADCAIGRAVSAIEGGAATILAPIDLGPAILLDSDHNVLATPHHRAHRTIAETYRMFTAPAEEARRRMAARDIDYVAICAGLAEMDLYREAAPDGLANGLATNPPPAWLEPVPHQAGDGVRIWRLVD